MKDKLKIINEGLEKCQDKMSNASKFIDFFVHDLLDYTILNKDATNFIKNPSIFDINTALEEMCAILEDKSSMKNVKIDIKFKGFRDHNTSVKTDKKRMQQVILNLMSNALKFTDRDGKIMLLVEKIVRDGSDFLRLSVVDSGIGIKEKDQGRLFKMFGSIKDEGKKINVHGVGLGLVICKMIVNKFDGHIDFVSKYKRGSTFFFTMKLDEIDQISEIQQKDTGIEIKESKEVKIFDSSKPTTTLFDIMNIVTKIKSMSRRVLLVDDEEFCISSMRAILFKLGLDVDTEIDFCMNGEEASNLVKFAKDMGISYKLIFTDFNMPIMNGLEATAKIRETLDGAEQPIIVGVTGYASSKYH